MAGLNVLRCNARLRQLAYRVGCFVVLAFGLASLSFGDSVSVSSFGRGVTRGDAIKAATIQAVEDALEATLSKNEKAIRGVVSNPLKLVRKTKTISLEKMPGNLYEAHVEVLVDVETGTSPVRKLKVALLVDQSQSYDAATAELLEVVREKLTRWPQFSVTMSSDPAIKRVVERFRTEQRQDNPEWVRSLPVDAVCIVSTESLPTRTERSIEETFEIRTKLVIVNISNGGTRTVRTLKTSVSGMPNVAGQAITINAGNQVAQVVGVYLSQILLQFSEKSKNFNGDPVLGVTPLRTNGIILNTDW